MTARIAAVMMMFCVMCSGAEWREGIASWYQVSCNSAGAGKPLGSVVTASGVHLDDGVLTCAHKSLPLGTVLEVKRGPRVVRVLVTDRGPYVRGRVLDLGKKAAYELDMGVVGVGVVEWRVVERISLKEYRGKTAEGWDAKKSEESGKSFWTRLFLWFRG